MFFDINEIMNSLLPQKDVCLLGDIDKSANVANDIKERLVECSSRWNGYVHEDFGDSYNECFINKNRCNFDNLYINRRAELADRVFEKMFVEQGGSFDRINELIKMICREDTWCVPSHRYKPENQKSPEILELFSAETCSVLALTYYFLKDKIANSEIIPQMIEERMFVPFLETDGYKWMGYGNKVNNWNPWINSNVAFCAACVCTDENEYRAIIKKVYTSIQFYVDGLPEDYCVDEGVRYWHLAVACLFDAVEILYDLTGGKINLNSTELMYRAAEYPINFYSKYGLAANFADAEINFPLDSILLYRIGEKTGNVKVKDFAGYLYNVKRLRLLHDNFYRQTKNIYTAGEIKKCACPEFEQRTMLYGVQVAVIRKGDFFFALKGGHNNENHSHNDVGSFVCYYRDNPIFIDPGVDLYSNHTFGTTRYNLWYMRSEYHNLPAISGKNQKNGSEYRTSEFVEEKDFIKTEISKAYALDGVYERRVYDNGNLKVSDSFSYPASEVELYYMTLEKPTVKDNVLYFDCGVKAVISGAEIVNIETVDITGKNPPDGYLGDAPYRKTDGISFLIPRLLTTTWNQNEIFRIVCKAKSQGVSLEIIGEK